MATEMTALAVPTNYELGKAAPARVATSSPAPTVAATAPSSQTAFAQARLLFQQRKYDEAIPTLNPVIASNPNLAPAYTLGAVSRIRSKQTAYELADFNYWLRLKPRKRGIVVASA